MRKFALIATSLALAAVTACAPPQASTPVSTADEETGTLRVWLFSEVNQAPKEQIVNEAIGEFEAAHDGVTVEVQYIPVDTRSERFRAAFNDPSSAPDVAEFGNTDLAGYVDAGGLADMTQHISGWEDAKDLDAAALETTKIDGVSYAVPWYVGVRALFYRTDVFEQLKLEAPKTLADVEQAALAIRAANSEMVGISTGGAAQFAYMPYLWAHGGELAVNEGDTWTSGLDSAEAKAGLAAYTRLISDDICPPTTCAEWGGNASVQQFVAGGAGMTIGGNFNVAAVDESDIGDSYAIIPLPGVEAGSIAPAFAGGNHLGVFKSSQRSTLAVDFVKLLAGKEYQAKMFDAMGNLPTFVDVQETVAAANPEMAPFIETIAAGTKFVPVTASWNTVDAQGVIPSLIQSVVTGAADVETASTSAAKTMNDVFAGQ
ncbi:extracellular solute-binding protein [Tessaracoccus caeni]|uniref:extracellular solute-binding protein n=1 Tax=Tessaracoccus caeni TaxID=3031239 RepID=UPI0023DB6B36|nr:extracellular solute-binding protein [Tessaracoccus caeni]MDF1488247.1 extracellular solute-binding protein [Tessaracoccus caeni]